MARIATTISDLFDDAQWANQIIEHSDCLECRDERMDSTWAGQEVFHCDLQPIHELNDAHFMHLRKIKKVKLELKLITFHAASVCDMPLLRNGAFEVGGKEYIEKELHRNARINFQKIKEIFGREIKLGIENNNYYPTRAYKIITEPEFLHQLVEENDIYLLFDIAHAKVSAYNKNIEYEKYKENLPLHRAVQLHICRHLINGNNFAFDAHEYPGGLEFDEVKNLQSDFSIEYLTIEYYKDIDNIIRSLRRLRESQ